MNILFVNYGDFTTNSLNHIGGFANTLCASGHACIVAVPKGKTTLGVVSKPLFIPATFDELLAKPGLFPDGRAADVIHAWTPREVVRRFVLGYQRHAHARLIIHLEDNEEFLLSVWFGRPISSLGELSESDFGEHAPAALSHPRRYRQFLRAADGATVIVEALRQFVPGEVPCIVLPPGVDPEFYRPRAADPELRSSLGLREDERVIVFTGSNTFANEPEMRELYVAVALLNARGIPTRLVRAGYNSPKFQAGLPETLTAHVLDLGFLEKMRLPGLLALADVLVQPGKAGPFNDFRLPSKLPEYFFTGRPVVLPASNIGADVRDGVDGLLLKTGSPEEIADACERIFKDPALAAALGKHAVEFGRKRFDLATQAKRLAEFYQDICNRAPRAGSTATLSGEETELTLALRALAAQSKEPAAAAVAADLAPLIEELERNDPARGERLRLESESSELARSFELVRQHAANLEAQIQPTREHAANLERMIEAGTKHSAQLEEELVATKRHAAHLEEQVGSTRQHAINLEEQAKSVRQHATNLTQELGDSRGRLLRLEGKYAISEKLLASTRRQLDALDAEYDTEITAAKSRIATLEQLLQLSEQHASNLEGRVKLIREHTANLENLHSTLQDRVAELDQQCAHLGREIASRDAAIARLSAVDAKVKLMQSSVSWRITAPLRYLRRTLIDPWRKPIRVVAAPPEASAVTLPPAPPRILSSDRPFPSPGTRPVEPAVTGGEPAAAASLGIWRSVDNPQRWSLPPRKTLVRGWCFADDGRKFKKVRAVLQDRILEGTYGFKRLDVLASVRGKPQAEYCGWQIEIELTPADNRLDLEVLDEAAAWHPFFHSALQIGEGLGPRDLTAYENWIEVYDSESDETLEVQRTEAEALRLKPLISVIMPVYNTPEKWLRRAVHSVRAQTYASWQLCICDDASTAAHVRPILEQMTREDPRIKVIFRDQNGHISAASNSALSLASGEYVALLDHDDELAPNALYEVAAAINAHPEADYLYSDEDKIDEDGHRHEPYFKPDWLPDLFVGQNYTSHLSVYRTSLVRETGGFRSGVEGSQDWDLALRIIEQTSPERIVHIPKVLYHWRAIPGSTALQLSEKNYPVEAARRALTDHFARRGETVELLPVPGDHWRVKRAIPSPAPVVSLIIPTRNRFELLRLCVESILTKTTYPNYEIVIVDNQSDDPAILAWFSEIQKPAGGRPSRVRVLHHDAPFNFSTICNFGVDHARGEIIGLLNNDLEVITSDWLEEMASNASRPEIGCVGAMLYYPNDTIQHAGIILGVGGVAGHAFRDFPRGTEGRFNRARLTQNYSAVTAACLLVRKSIYEDVGGLDEDALAVAFNDVDFCLKVRAAGYLNLWTPFAEFYHHESASRGADDTPEKAERFRLEVETMLRRWGPVLPQDPAYNPNLTLELNDFSLASPPRPGRALSGETLTPTQDGAGRWDHPEVSPVLDPVVPGSVSP